MKKDRTPQFITWKDEQCKTCKFDVHKYLTPNCTYPSKLEFDKKGKCKKFRKE